MAIPPRINDLAVEVANKHNVSAANVLGRSRWKGDCSARRELYYRIRTIDPVKFTYPNIGRILGRCHTTIISGIKRHCELNGIDVPMTREEWLNASHL